jgi:hypothetical protein
MILVCIHSDRVEVRAGVCGTGGGAAGGAAPHGHQPAALCGARCCTQGAHAPILPLPAKSVRDSYKHPARTPLRHCTCDTLSLLPDLVKLCSGIGLGGGAGGAGGL